LNQTKKNEKNEKTKQKHNIFKIKNTSFSLFILKQTKNPLDDKKRMEQRKKKNKMKEVK